MRVAVLGTGTMGAGMARSMLRAGLDVTAWNRTADRAGPLRADGATVAGTVPDAVGGADVVVTMVFDAAAVLDLGATLVAAMPGEAVWVQSATIGLDGIAQVERLAGEHGVPLLDAPMLGTKQPADEGALVPLVAGPRELARRVQPVFDAVGAKTIYAGDRIGQGTALKLACNAWIASLTAALGQSLGLAAALGIEPGLFLEAIDGGPADAPYAHQKGKEMLAGDYPPSFSVDGVLKDVGLMVDAADAAGFPQALLRPVQEAYARASAAGHGGDDIAAVHTEFRPGTAR
jgi:3-hydroxyisobutyrate dehydrogenase